MDADDGNVGRGRVVNSVPVRTCNVGVGSGRIVNVDLGRNITIDFQWPMSSGHVFLDQFVKDIGLVVLVESGPFHGELPCRRVEFFEGPFETDTTESIMSDLRKGLSLNLTPRNLFAGEMDPEKR